MRGAQNAGQDLLCLSASMRSIAAPAHLPSDDGRTEGLLGPPVRGVEIGINEEAEERREFDREMSRKALHLRDRAWIIERVEQSVKQMPARDSDPMRGDGPRRTPIPHAKRVLQNPRDACWETRSRMIALQRATPSEEVAETRLMKCVDELPIRRPAIAAQAAREISAEDRRGIVEPPTAPNAIHGGGRRRKHPEPIQQTAHLPSGFIGHHYRARAHGVAQGRVRELALGGRPMQGPHDCARRDREAEARPTQRRNLAERQPVMFVQTHRQRDCLWTQLHRRCAERIRGLERMASLHPAATAATATNVNRKAAHDPFDRRQVLLILSGDVRFVDSIAALRTGLRERHLMPLMDHRRDPALAPPAIVPSRFAARPPRSTLRRPLRERRSLAESRATRGVQLLFESVVLSLQSIAFPLDLAPFPLGPRQFLPQPRNLTLLAFDSLVTIIARSWRVVGHATFMADSRKKYKYGIGDPLSDAVTRYDVC